MPLKLSLHEKLDLNSIPEPTSGCILWTAGCNCHGYGIVHEDGKQYKAHRVSWERKNGPIPAGLFVCHKCDVRPCINPDHLFLGTQAENLADMTAKGRRGRGSRPRYGEDNCNTKLTADKVLAIRAAQGSQKQIAASFNVSQPTVSLIKTGKTWSHLGGLSCL